MKFFLTAGDNYAPIKDDCFIITDFQLTPLTHDVIRVISDLVTDMCLHCCHSLFLETLCSMILILEHTTVVIYSTYSFVNNDNPFIAV